MYSGCWGEENGFLNMKTAKHNDFTVETIASDVLNQLISYASFVAHYSAV